MLKRKEEAEMERIRKEIAFIIGDVRLVVGGEKHYDKSGNI